MSQEISWNFLEAETEKSPSRCKDQQAHSVRTGTLKEAGRLGTSDSESREDRSRDPSSLPEDKLTDKTSAEAVENSDENLKETSDENSKENSNEPGAESSEASHEGDLVDASVNEAMIFVEGDDDDELLADEQPKFSDPSEPSEPSETSENSEKSKAPAKQINTENSAQSIHDAARQAAALADSEELKIKLDRKAPDKAIQAAAAVLQQLDAGDNQDFDDWLDALDAKLAAASALLDKAAAEKEAMYKVEAEIAAAQKMAAERVQREKQVAEKKIIKERRRTPRENPEVPTLDSAPDSVPPKGNQASQPGAAPTAPKEAQVTSAPVSDPADKVNNQTKQESATTASNSSNSANSSNSSANKAPKPASAIRAKSGDGSASSARRTVPAKAQLPAVAAKSIDGSSTPPTTPTPPSAPTAVPQSSTGAPMYDAELADEYVKFKRLAFDDRFWRMSKLIMDYAKVTAKNKWLPDRKISEAARNRDLAIRFREALVELGPTFIKLGQFLSVRRDLLDADMADELATLQDNVPPFPADLAIKTIAAELGQEPEKLFLEFDNTPLASASIGQVHRARLHDGREVVVKVQRPDLAAKFYQDLGYMRSLIRWGRKIKPEGDWDGWLALSDEFGRSLFSEIDYLQEGKNADRMRINLRDSERIRIPRVIWKYTGRHVLAFEYVPGIKIDKIAELKARNFDLVEIGNQLVYAYLEQVLIHGYFHADPHAGNLAIDDEGRIIIYDFGMVGEISEGQRLAIAGCVTSVIDKSGEDVAEHLVELGVLKADANKAPIVRTLTPFIDYYSGRSMKDLEFTNLERDIDQITLERALKLPANLAYLLRAGSSVEGIARTLQPDFSFVEAAKPFIQRWLLSKPTAFGALLKIFLKYSREAYRSSTEKLTGGAGIFGFGKRKSKIHSQEHTRAQQPRSGQSLPGPGTNFGTSAGIASDGSASSLKKSEKIDLRSTSSSTGLSANSASNMATNMPIPDINEQEEWSQNAGESANQALERDRQNQQRQIYLLETRLGKSVRLQMVLGWSAVGALVFSSLFLIASFLAHYRSYAHYFLIGNGVMGAIILWHLVEAALLGNKFQGKR